MPKTVKKLNPAEQRYDTLTGSHDNISGGLRPDEIAKLKQMEVGLRNSGIDRNDINSNEQSGVSDRWKDYTTATHSKNSDTHKKKFLLRRIGASTGLAGALIAAIISIGSITSIPGVFYAHLKEGFLKKWDTRTVTATVRTNKILASKISNSTTEGSCSLVKVMCRFGRPSNKLLKNLEKQKVTAFTADGREIKSNGLFPNKRPAYYEMERANGSKLTVQADAFSDTLNKDVEFRKAFRTAYNTRFENFSDSVFQEVLTSFGATKASQFSDAKNEADIKEKINSDVAGEDIGAKAAAEEGDEATKSVFKKLFGDEIHGSLSKISNIGKGGDALLMAAGVGCVVADAPGIAAKVVRSYQMAQLIKYGMVFLNVFDKTRAGDATQEEVSAIGSLLTSVTRGADGEITSGAAVDSFGVKYALFGDTNAKNYKKDYTNFSPGGNIVASLAPITKLTNSEQKKDLCEAATNPLTGAALKAGLAAAGGATFGTTAILAGVEWAGGVIGGEILEALTPQLTDFAVSTFGGLFNDMLSYFLGDLTQNLTGEDAGNALASGAAHLLSQSSNAGGNIPMSISGALAFQEVSNQVNLAYAEEDRFGRSPFDISSPNTFMGSIVNRFIPYVSSMNSASGVLSALSSVSMSGFGSLFNPMIGASDGGSKQYTMCSDSSINDGVTAVGPFCNIVYGIPTKYLSRDPKAIIQTLIDEGQIDENTGDPKENSDLANWVSLCLDGKTDQMKNCRIEDNETYTDEAQRSTIANYALYTVDHQIQKSMDGEDIVDQSTGSIPSITGLPDGGVKDTADGREQAWELNEQFIKDLNAIRKSNFPDIKDYSLGYNKSAGTPGRGASGGPCFTGASNCDQCYALTAWFLNKFTKLTIGTTSGSGDGVVQYLGRKGVPVGNVAKVYSVFSYGRAVDGDGAHTGIVIGVDGDYAITIENNHNFGGTLYINRRPIDGDKFRGTGEKTVFAYINDYMRDTPKEY